MSSLLLYFVLVIICSMFCMMMIFICLQVAMVEANIDDGLPNSLLIVFGISTTLVVVIHLMALMVSTCMYPDIEAVANGNRIEVSIEL